jgi:hypothetical protein
MAQIFGNIFEDEKEEGSSAVRVTTTEPTDRQTAAQGESIFGDIFAENNQTRQDSLSQTPQDVAVEPSNGFLTKSANAGKSVVKFGLDALNLVNRTFNDVVIQKPAAVLARTKFIQEAAAGLDAMEKGEVEFSNKAYIGKSLLETLSNPVVATLNTKAGKATVTTISEKSSNIPLKGLARLSAIGDKTYEEAYTAWLAERNDPQNPTWQKFLYELQDTGVQTGIGVLLSLGATAATRNPQAGYAVSGAFYTALSADEQIQERGKVESTANIAIDVVGDQMLNRLLVGILGNSSKGAIINALKGFGVEGSTEVSQSFLKYANDYGNARTEEEKQAVLASAKNYVTSGGMALEFFVGGVVGATIAGVTGEFSGGGQPAPIPNKATTRPPITEESIAARQPVTDPVDVTIDGLNMSEVRDKLVQFQREFDPNSEQDVAIYSAMNDVLNDYATAFNDKTFFVPSTVTNSPLIEIETVKFPDGKFAAKYSMNTLQSGFSSTYDFTTLFDSQKAASEDAVKQIIARAQTEIESVTDPEARTEFEQILDYAQNGKTKPEVPADQEALPADSFDDTRVVFNEELKSFVAQVKRGDRYVVLGTFSTEQKANDFINLQKERVTQQAAEITTSPETAQTEPEQAQSAQDIESTVTELETQLRAAYAATGASELEGFTKADEMLSQIAIEMELSQAGERIFVPAEVGGGSDVIGIPSTFPEWVPEELRSSKLFGTVMGSLEVSKLSYPKGNRTKQRRLYQTVLDELDAQLGIDTSDIRNKIIEAYDNQTENRQKGGAAKADRGGTKGGAKPQPKKRAAKKQVAPAQKSSTSTRVNGNDDVVAAYAKNYLGFNLEFLVKQAKAKKVNLFERLVKEVDSQETTEAKIAAMTAINNDLSVPEKSVPEAFNPPSAGNAFMRAAFEGDVWGALPEDTPAPLPEKLGGINAINPVELPELVDITRELLGKVPQVTKRVLSKKEAYGVFIGDQMNPRIRILADLFSQNKLPEATKVLAHEMGHMIDWLPDQTMSRGNLIGSLFSLRKYMSDTFSPDGSKFDAKDRAKVRSEVEREVMAERGIKNRKELTADDKARIKKLYKARVDLYIENDGYIRNETIKKELMTATRYWHPWDSTKATPQYNAYRESARELYAEALSMLLVSPKKLSEMAPTFYEQFFAGLDTKPEVRNVYFEVQALLSGDRQLLTKRRREGVRRMFKEGDYKAIDLHNRKVDEIESRRKRYWEHFKHTVIDKNYQIIDRVKKAERSGKQINPDENPEYFLEERNYIGGKIKAVFERDFQPIYTTLTENEVLWEDFGEVLFYERIASGDRSDVANPRGITPAAAQELLDTIKKEYGDERWSLIQEQASKFRAAARAITERAYEAGLYKPELYEKMQENPAYVTFQVLDHLEDGMTSRVYKSLGTLKDIANPADSTMLKVITTIRAAERNETTQATINFLKAEFPTEVKEAKYTASKKGRFPIPSKKPDEELVTFFEKGVLKGYYVDPYIAETINNQSVGQNAPIVPAIRFMNSTFFRPLFIQFNLGFQTFNLIRDFVRFYKNTPSMTMLRALQRYGQATRVAKVRAFGLPKNPSTKDLEAQRLLEQAEAEGVLSITFNDVISGRSEVDKQVEKILADTGIKDFQPKPTYERVPRFAKPAVKALNKAGILDVTSSILGFIEDLGNYIETLPKAAGIYEYRGTKADFLTKEQKSFIRRKLGSPDFLAGGTYKPITNEVFLFSNAIIQGIRADIEVATDPKTRSGFWWKTTKVVFLPKMLMLAVLYGAFGDELKDLMESASEYDRTNYLIIPLGRDENNKAVYFRVPVDETSRFLGGVMWKAMTMASKEDPNIGRDLMDIASYTGGQLPSISPAVQAFTATTQYLSGQNPYDAFRGRQILSDTVFQAGGTQAHLAYAGWLFQQLGGGIFYRFYHEPTPPREQSDVEKFFNLPLLGNVAGRFVRVSDYGKLEQLKSIEDQVRTEEAQRTLAERELVNDYVRQAQEKNIKFNTASIEREMVRELFAETNGVPRTKKDQERADRLVKKFRLQLKRGDASPEVAALIDANTNAQKIAILKDIRETMSDEEFAGLRRDLVSAGIASTEVFTELDR